MKREKCCAIINFRLIVQGMGRTAAQDHENTERNKNMAAFFGEFIVQLIKLIILAGVSLAAIFCGKKLRDHKDARKAAQTSGK